MMCMFLASSFTCSCGKSCTHVAGLLFAFEGRPAKEAAIMIRQIYPAHQNIVNGTVLTNEKKGGGSGKKANGV